MTSVCQSGSAAPWGSVGAPRSWQGRASLAQPGSGTAWGQLRDSPSPGHHGDKNVLRPGQDVSLWVRPGSAGLGCGRAGGQHAYGLGVSVTGDGTDGLRLG